MRTILFVLFFFTSLLLPQEGEAKLYENFCLLKMTLEEYFLLVEKELPPSLGEEAKLFEKLNLGRKNNYTGEKGQKEKLWRRLLTLRAIRDIRNEYGDILGKMQRKYNFDPDLIRAIIITETLNCPCAISQANAYGIMQTREIADKEVNIGGNSFDPEISIQKGVAYLTRLRDFYGIKDIKRMIVAYNEGPHGVRRFSNRQIEKHRYLRTVLWVLEKIKSGEDPDVMNLIR